MRIDELALDVRRATNLKKWSGRESKKNSIDVEVQKVEDIKRLADMGVHDACAGG